MNDQTVKHLFSCFARSEQILDWKSFGHGHINDTYLIQTVGEQVPDFILQRKNHQILAMTSEPEKRVPGGGRRGELCAFVGRGIPACRGTHRERVRGRRLLGSRA